MTLPEVRVIGTTPLSSAARAERAVRRADPRDAGHSGRRPACTDRRRAGQSPQPIPA